jgi:two-component system, NtrC family, sensor histidine kinase HydH
MSRWTRLLRPQDLVWLLLFGVIAAASETRDAWEIGMLAALAAVQVVEPKLTALSTRGGRVFWIALKLVLGYLLIGYTHGLSSPYFLVLLLPVVSAATTFGVLGSLVFALLSSGAYLSFLLFVDWSQYSVDIQELVLRAVFLAMAGNLANMLAEDLRAESRKNRRAAQHLAEVNEQLHAAEEAVRRSDRLAALGQLSGGLAHELRNPLGTIKTSAEMLARNVAGENEVAREMAGFICSEVDRTNSLVTRFLQFARPLELRCEPAALTAVIDRAVTQVEREAPQVTIYKNYAPEIPPVPLDAELMERVFYNLLLNAAQATAAGGAVTVKTRALDGVAEIAVIDRGNGIEARLRDSIFNPFFTTKPQGVGLGLAIVSKIVDQHGGKITVESEEGKGSTFRVALPLSGAAPAA